MKAHEFLALDLKPGDRVIVNTTDGITTETTYDGLKAWTDVIREPDVHLAPRFRAPTVYFGGDMAVPFQRIRNVKKTKD